MAVEKSGTISGELSEKEVTRARSHSTLRFISVATVVTISLILAIGVNVIADHNFIGWLAVLAITAALDVAAWLVFYPRKRNKLWIGIALVCAALPVVLMLTGVTGRTTNLSVQEKQAIANATKEQDAKSFTHVIEVVDPNCTMSATVKDWGNAVRYTEGDGCALEVDLTKASVTVFGTESLGKVADSNDIVKLPVLDGRYPKFFVNVADYPGGKYAIPADVLGDSTKTRFYPKR